MLSLRSLTKPPTLLPTCEAAFSPRALVCLPNVSSSSGPARSADLGPEDAVRGFSLEPVWWPTAAVEVG
jgi:hypothetical protein